MATWRHDGRGPGSHVPSRNTGRGVYRCGELKGLKPVGEGKPKCEQPACRRVAESERARSHIGQTRNRVI